MIGEPLRCPGTFAGRRCYQLCGYLNGDRLEYRSRLRAGCFATIDAEASTANITCPACGCTFAAATSAISRAATKDPLYTRQTA